MNAKKIFIISVLPFLLFSCFREKENEGVNKGRFTSEPTMDGGGNGTPSPVLITR